MVHAAKGLRPPKEPQGSPRGESYADVWAVAEACWGTDPASRTTAEEAMKRLNETRAALGQNSNSRSTVDSSDHPSTRVDFEAQSTANRLKYEETSSTRHQEPPTSNPKRRGGWRSWLRKLVAPLMRVIQTFRTPAPSPTHPQLVSMVTANPRLGDVVGDIVDLGENIKFDRSSMVLHAMGGSGDIYRTELQQSRIKIAVKVLRVMNTPGSDSEPDLMGRRMGRELAVWKALDHKRVIPLLGFAMLPIEPRQGSPCLVRPCLVSPWCANGNAMEYLKKCPTAHRGNLILQVAEGLVHLHTHDPPIIHADIKAGNVLIDDNGEAMLCDFGLAKFLGDVSSGFTTSTDQKGTPRWMAPEQFQQDGTPVYTIEADIYAFGCFILGAVLAFPFASND
ncbi:hypothetical protein FRB99_002845 [Tulasnella sp. 403]|nr:hypothetical protein FRB99_002845 [Tulasnella sp. 403]